MGDFGTGFVTGFANSLADGINTRNKDARDFFEKQVEYARTTGLANRNKVKQQVQDNVSVARQLEQVGVPKDVIMAQVNQNPAGLGDFFNQVETIRAKSGKPLSAEEWKAIYKVAGDFKAPDEDLSTFISRTYDPIANAVASEGFEDNPEESLVASMLGFNAMGRARKGLGKTIIAEGLTADQLIKYGDTQPQRIGGSATVTTNYENVPKKPGEGGLSPSEVASVYKFVADQVDTEITLLERGGAKEGDDVTETRDNLLTELTKIYGNAVSPDDLKRMVDNAIKGRRYTLAEGTSEGGGETLVDPSTSPVEGPPDVFPETGSPEPTPPSVEPPTAPTEATTSSKAPIDTRKEPHLEVITIPNDAGQMTQFTLVRDNGDGSSTYMDLEGNEEVFGNNILRTALAP